MLDRDLAQLYGVTTGRLNEQVRRNSKRFPADFMFQLSKEEFENWISQIAISNPAPKWACVRSPRPSRSKASRCCPAFSTATGPSRSTSRSCRTFVKLREILATHKDLVRKLDDIERKLGQHDEHFRVVFEAIRQLIDPTAATRQEAAYRLRARIANCARIGRCSAKTTGCLRRGWRLRPRCRGVPRRAN